MTFADDRNSDRKRRADGPEDEEDVTGSAGKGAANKDRSPEVGGALRSAYQQTLQEDIPPEMLDLLGKLS